MAVVGKLDFEQALRDAAAAIEVAKEGGKVGIVGYCFGGTSPGRRRPACRASPPRSAITAAGSSAMKDLEPKSSDPAAFRREGSAHPGRRGEGVRRGPSRTSRSTSTRPTTASTAITAKATTPRAPPSPGHARWSFSASIWGERLSSLSSDLPWPIVSENGVEDGQELSRESDESDHFGFASGDEAIEESFQDGVVAFGDHSAHEQGSSDGGASSADETAAAPLAGLAGERGQASERGDLLAAELPNLGSSAISVRAMVGPTPGAEARRFSLSRQAGEPRTASSISSSTLASSFSSALSSRVRLLRRCGIVMRFSRWRSATIISMICRRRATRSASSRVASSGNGRISGLVASAKRAMTAASIGSVLARCPSALAKDQICAGLTTTTGRPAAARAGCGDGLKAASRLRRDNVQDDLLQA